MAPKAPMRLSRMMASRRAGSRPARPSRQSASPSRWIPPVAAGLLAAVSLAAFVARRLGGITGDVLGACLEIAELAALLTVAAWTYARL